MATATYPIRLREWVRPGERVVCPDCKGLRWVPIVILAKDGNDWTTTVDCPECHGRGWVVRDEGEGSTPGAGVIGMIGEWQHTKG